MSLITPHYLFENNSNISFRISLVKILEANVAFISNEDEDMSQLYNCKFITLDTLKEKITYPDGWKYDGSTYPQTFEYYSNKNGELIIDKADTLIIGFLGEEYVKYEKYIKNLKKQN